MDNDSVGELAAQQVLLRQFFKASPALSHAMERQFSRADPDKIGNHLGLGLHGFRGGLWRRFLLPGISDKHLRRLAVGRPEPDDRINASCQNGADYQDSFHPFMHHSEWRDDPQATNHSGMEETTIVDCNQREFRGSSNLPSHAQLTVFDIMTQSLGMCCAEF